MQAIHSASAATQAKARRLSVAIQRLGGEVPRSLTRQQTLEAFGHTEGTLTRFVQTFKNLAQAKQANKKDKDHYDSEEDYLRDTASECADTSQEEDW